MFVEVLFFMVFIKMVGKNLDKIIFILGLISLFDIILENSLVDFLWIIGFVLFVYRFRR